MPTGPRKAELILTSDELTRLKSFAQSRTLAPSIVMRAKLVLACATGATNTEVARQHGVTIQMVGRWRSRFVEHRVSGLFDDVNCGGRPRAIDQETRIAEYVAEMYRKAGDAGRVRWNVREIVESTGVPRASVYTYLNRMGVRLERWGVRSMENGPLSLSWCPAPRLTQPAIDQDGIFVLTEERALPTVDQVKEFQDSYEAFDDVRKRHSDEWETIISNGLTDTSRLLELVSELDKAYKRFMTAGLPFVGGRKLSD